jgi:hypothetical protein
MPVAHRVKRLRQLAKAFRRARDLVDKVMQDDIGNDLFRGWCAETSIPPASYILSKEGSLARAADEMEDAVANLTTLNGRHAERQTYAPRGGDLKGRLFCRWTASGHWQPYIERARD